MPPDNLVVFSANTVPSIGISPLVRIGGDRLTTRHRRQRIGQVLTISHYQSLSPAAEASTGVTGFTLRASALLLYVSSLRLLTVVVEVLLRSFALIKSSLFQVTTTSKH